MDEHKTFKDPENKSVSFFEVIGNTGYTGILRTQSIWNTEMRKASCRYTRESPIPLLQDLHGAEQSLPFTGLSFQALQPGQLGCITGGRPNVWEELLCVNWLIKTGDMILIQGLFCIHLVVLYIGKHWQLAMHTVDSI